MAWTHNPADNAYTLMRGDIRCRVWQTTLGNWGAAINRRGVATAAYNFETADEAKTWCETPLAREP